MKNKISSRAFSLLEVMVAVGVLSVATYAIISMIRGGTLGQKTLQAQDDARTLVSDLSATLTSTAACTNTFGSGAVADGGTLLPKYTAALANPSTGATITSVYDGASTPVFTVGQPYGNRGVILNGITIGGAGTDAKTKLQKWTPGSASTGLAFVQVDWLQSGGAGNSSGPQHLYRFFTVNVTKMNASGQILSCSAQSGSASMGTGQPNYIAAWLTSSTIGASTMYQDPGTLNIGFGTATPSAPVEISGNAASLPPQGGNINGTMLHLGNSDGTKTRILLDAFQNGVNVFPVLSLRSARGTAASPSGLQSGDTSGVIEIEGYGSSKYTGSAGGVNFYATENWGDSANGSAIAFATTGNGTVGSQERMRIDQNGNVGIGNFSAVAPAYTLQVGPATGSGTVASGSFYYLSDRNLKKDIEPLSSRGSVLDRLDSLNGVYFRWKETSLASIGLIAQDVAKEFPELVDMREAGHWHVQYGNLVAIAIEAIKELKAKFLAITNNHEDRIKELEQQLVTLQKDNLEMKKQIGTLLRQVQKN